MSPDFVSRCAPHPRNDLEMGYLNPGFDVCHMTALIELPKFLFCIDALSPEKRFLIDFKMFFPTVSNIFLWIINNLFVT